MKNEYGWWKLASLVFVIIIILSMFFLAQDFYSSNKINEEHCIVKGSIEHEMRVYHDYPLAKLITKSGYKLGPFFDYNFCDGGEE